MKYIKITSFVVLLFVLNGCKKWLDVNTDPATPQVAKAEFYLSPIIAQMGVNSASDGLVIAKYTQGMLSQDVIEASTSFEKHGWYVASDLGGNLWRMVYINHGINLNAMISDAEANNKWTYAGIGYAIKAWGFQMLTDSHGPVILDEAFADQLTFKYQDQPEVYAKVRQWCQTALVCLSKPDVGNLAPLLSGASGDQIYKGDRAKWRKFIYGILALQYSHLVNKPEFKTQYADSVIKYVDLSFNAGSATPSAADDPTIFYNGSGTPFVTYNNIGDCNPLSQGYGTVAPSLISTSSSYGRIGQPIVDLLTGGVKGTPTVNPTSSTDPRLTRMINPMSTPTVPATNGVYRGIMPTIGDVATTKTIPSVLGSVTGTATVPYPGKYIFSNTARYPLMSYAQLQFAKAEALFAKGDLPNAYTAYLNGIKGHMDFVNLYGRNGSVVAPAITATEINTYLASTEVAQNAASLTLADIMGQKYIAQWGWANMEQWSDLRKYHYDPLIFRQFKQLESSQFFANNGGMKYAYRLRPRYNSEYVWNKNELAKWGGLAIDYHTKETWFSLP